LNIIGFATIHGYGDIRAAVGNSGGAAFGFVVGMRMEDANDSLARRYRPVGRERTTRTCALVYYGDFAIFVLYEGAALLLTLSARKAVTPKLPEIVVDSLGNRDGLGRVRAGSFRARNA